jgi:hypothetical protein
VGLITPPFREREKQRWKQAANELLGKYAWCSC